MSAIAFKPTWGTRTYVMGILNVSPDSFSGDGIVGSEHALEMTLGMVEDGADIIDIGGESTRPGADPVSLEEELGRVLPAVELLVERLGVPISVDTYKAEVAQAALERGVTMINDIWGLKQEPRLADMAAQYDAHLVLMSNQRDVSPRHDVEFPDVVDVVLRDLTRATSLAMARGVPKDHIIIDPGIGFGKTQPQNVELLRRLGELRTLGFPMLVGTSRKSVLGHILDLPADERLEATAATVALAVSLGTDVVRVHDVRAMSRVCKVTDAIVRG